MKKGEKLTQITAVKSVLSFVFGFLIYIFIFMYGSMVMRGVIEENQIES